MKEIVPGSSRAFQSSTEELLFMDIVDWKTDLLKKLGQNYKVVSLYTVASYQGSKTDEQLRSDLACLLDLIAMFAILTEWRGRWPSKSLTLSVILQLQEEVALAAVAAAPPPTQTPQSTQRRSATATQEAALAYIYGTEAATDDIGKMMNREWQCKNRDCKNMSKTCWRDKSKAVDLAHNHYPVKGETLRKWMAEINSGLSTVEQPSSSVVTEVVEQRVRDKKKQPEQVAIGGGGVAGFAELQAQTTTLLQSIALSQLRQQAEPSSPSPFVGAAAATATTSPLAHNRAQGPPSSPIQATESQEDELLTAFFAWCRNLPKYSKKSMILRKAEEALVTGEWELSALSFSAPAGKRLTDEDWKAMELPQGLLVALRSRLSEWKVYRKSMATTDDEFEDIS